jgi:hypothetical protein
MGEIAQTIAAFVRGLIAADYSVRTIDASTGDLAQFAGFLGMRGVERAGDIARADVTDFAAALADPDGFTAFDPGLVPGVAPDDRGTPRTRPYARSTTISSPRVPQRAWARRSCLDGCPRSSPPTRSPGCWKGSEAQNRWNCAIELFSSCYTPRDCVVRKHWT